MKVYFLLIQHPDAACAAPSLRRGHLGFVVFQQQGTGGGPATASLVGSRTPDPSPASRGAGNRDPMSIHREKLTEVPCTTPAALFLQMGQSTAAWVPCHSRLSHPLFLPWLDSVLINVIHSLVPIAGLSTRRGHGACLSSGPDVISVTLRCVQTVCPLKQWFVNLRLS